MGDFDSRWSSGTRPVAPEELPDGVAELARRRDAAARHRAAAVVRQRERGRWSAWERIGELLDPGSFVETGALVRHRSQAPSLAGKRPPGDAVVTGHGTVDDAPVCVFAQDFTVFGGSLGEAVGEKIVKVMDLALDAGAPVVGINDSAGGRIQEGVVAQSLYGQIFARNVAMSGAVPQISVICGPCAGGAAYSPALTDFVVMVDGTSHMFVTGPEVLREAVGERVGLEELGGARMHNSLSGTAHHLAADEADAFRYVRALLSYLPSAGAPAAGPRPPDPSGGGRPLSHPVRGADARQLLGGLLDKGEFLEVQALFVPEAVTGFGRIGGAAVGVVAAGPREGDASLTGAAGDKTARFVRTCDAFGLPVITLAGARGAPGAPAAPGALPGRDGLTRLMYAYAEATVPLLTVVTGDVPAAAHLALGSRHLGGDVNLAWPTARIGGTDAFTAAESGVVDEVVDPRDTRDRLHRALWLLRAKRRDRAPRKHGNLPL